MQVLATNLSDNAVDFREIDYTSPDLHFDGTGENRHHSGSVGTLADQDIIIPMIGMVQSLNVSVASALILYEAQRQRQNAGMYLRENSMLPEAEQQRLLFEGGYPVLANVAAQRPSPTPTSTSKARLKPTRLVGYYAGCRVIAMKGRLLDAVPLSSPNGVGAAQSKKLAKNGLHTVQGPCLPPSRCATKTAPTSTPSANCCRAFMPR